MKPEFDVTVRNKLLHFFSQAGTQTAIASKIGISVQSLNNYIKHRRAFTPGLILRICQAYKLPENYFYNENELAIPEARKIPVVSYVHAGQFLDPIELYQPGQAEHWVATDSRDPGAYALIVKGDSMEPEFREGDIITVAPGRKPKNGMIIIARYDGEVQLRKYQKAGDSVLLIPLNPAYETTVLIARQLKMFHSCGTVEALTRQIKHCS